MQHMFRIITTVLIAFVAMGVKAQIKVEVCESVELMSILSRTAGFEEYCIDLAGQYSKDMEIWFSPHKKHSAVTFYQDIRSDHGIGYERVMQMAINLSIENGEVKFIGDRSELSNGWQKVNLDEFLKRLNLFYTETRFHDFFEQHRPFYETYLKAYETNVMPQLNTEWFSRFHYGKEPSEQFHVIIGFAIGYNNYGISRQLPEKGRDLFAICGYWIDQAIGRPRYDASLLFHEFNHPFINHLLDNDDNTQLMENTGRKLLELSKSSMEKQHYDDWRIVINESLVRASVIIYMQDSGYKQEQVLNMLAMEIVQNGFTWMLDLVGTLRYYTSHREQYNTLNDFYPQIARSLEHFIKTQDRENTKTIK